MSDLLPVQRDLARLLFSLPAATGYALAGGAALIVQQIVDRDTAAERCQRALAATPLPRFSGNGVVRVHLRSGETRMFRQRFDRSVDADGLVRRLQAVGLPASGCTSTTTAARATSRCRSAREPTD